MNTQTQFEGPSVSPFKTRRDNCICGWFVAPANGRGMDNVTPIIGAVVGEVTRGTSRS